jgi:hypothetical protein
MKCHRRPRDRRMSTFPSQRGSSPAPGCRAPSEPRCSWTRLSRAARATPPPPRFRQPPTRPPRFRQVTALRSGRDGSAPAADPLRAVREYDRRPAGERPTATPISRQFPKRPGRSEVAALRVGVAERRVRVQVGQPAQVARQRRSRLRVRRRRRRTRRPSGVDQRAIASSPRRDRLRWIRRPIGPRCGRDVGFVLHLGLRRRGSPDAGVPASPHVEHLARLPSPLNPSPQAAHPPEHTTPRTPSTRDIRPASTGLQNPDHPWYSG